MSIKKTVAAVAALGAVALGCNIATIPATADPVSNSYAIVGSDTLEDVVSALVNGTAITGSFVRVSQNGSFLGSFDATGSDYIVTKPDGIRFGRPNGSGDGVKALSAAFSTTWYGATKTFTPTAQAGKTISATSLSSLFKVAIPNQVDISRSSSSSTPTVAGTTTVTQTNGVGALTRIPFGQDAISIVYNTGITGLDANGYIPTAQLLSAYSCLNTVTQTMIDADATLAGHLGQPLITANGNTFPVVPVVPQAGSGTRKDFLKKIGVDGSGNGNLISGSSSCVLEGQEHDATSTAFTSATNTIMPMSASRWVAMNTGASYDKRGTATMGSTVAGQDAVTAGTKVGSLYPDMVPNSAFYADATWGRTTYLIVETGRIDSTYDYDLTTDGVQNTRYDANLAALLDVAQNKLANVQTTLASKVGSVKKKFGFLAPLDTAITRCNTATSTQ